MEAMDNTNEINSKHLQQKTRPTTQQTTKHAKQQRQQQSSQTIVWMQQHNEQHKHLSQRNSVNLLQKLKFPIFCPFLYTLLRLVCIYRL